MIKYLLILFIFISPLAYSEGETQTPPPQQQESPVVDSAVIQWFVDSFNDVFEVVEHTPNFIERVFAYIIEYYVYLKFYFALESLKFSYGVAQALITNVGLDTLITTAVERLSPQHQSILQAFGFLRAITIICEAAVLRFVLNFMGW